MQLSSPTATRPSLSDPIGVGLLGCGVVGTGVARLLLDRHEDYARHVGVPVVLRKVGVRDAGRDRGLDPQLLTSELQHVIDDPAVHVIVEVMGGVEPARTLLLRALEAGKSVVTANKEVLAKHGRELFAMARRTGAELWFEGAVGGGIPVIMPLQRGLVANRLAQVSGIVNGTTNYILTQMAAHGAEFQDALKEAQRLGYAEADPTADVGGHDAAYKTALLAGLMLGAPVDVDRVHREGIDRITPRDLSYARELGYAIKLLGIAKRSIERFEVRVHPTMIPLAHPLARIDGATNAITVEGDAVGEVTFSGPGAGQMPTASAVVGDLLNLATSLRRPGAQPVDAAEEPARAPCAMGEIRSAYYLRLVANDVPGALGALGTVFGRHGVSIRSFVQKEVVDGRAELVFVTHRVREQALMDALAEARSLPALREVANLIRVEDAADAR